MVWPITALTRDTYRWYWSAVDATGRNVSAAYVPGVGWHVGVDVAGPHVRDDETGTFRHLGDGTGFTAGGIFQRTYKKSLGLVGTSTHLYWASGRLGDGGLYRRPHGVGQRATLLTSAYSGSADGGTAEPREVGKMLAIDSAEAYVVWACRKASNTRACVVRWNIAAGTATELVAPGAGHDSSLHGTAVAIDPNNEDIVYISADTMGPDNLVGSTPKSTRCGLWAIVGWRGGSPSAPIQLNTVGTGAPSGNRDWRQIGAVNEGGTTVLYALVGDRRAGDTGVMWRGVITWSGTTPTITWSDVSGTLSNSSGHSNMVVWRDTAAGKTRAMVFNYDETAASSGTWNYSVRSVTGAAQTYRQKGFRCLDASSPTWECITTSTNLSTAEVSSGETWNVLTALGNKGMEASRWGGNSWTPSDVGIRADGAEVMVAGKLGSWITSNPWTANAADVMWKPFVQGTGAIRSMSLVLRKVGGQMKLATTDGDRTGYLFLTGPWNAPTWCLDSLDDDLGNPWGAQQQSIIGRQIFPDGAGAICVVSGAGAGDAFLMRSADLWGAGSWYTDGFRDVRRNATASLRNVGRWTIAGQHTYVLVEVDTVTHQLFIRVARGSGGVDPWSSWSTTIGTPSSTFVNDVTMSIPTPGSGPSRDDIEADARARILYDGGTAVLVHIPFDGLWLCPDITAGTRSWSRVWQQTFPMSSTDGYYGEQSSDVVQDLSTPTTVYVGWGRGTVYRVTNAFSASSYGVATNPPLTAVAFTGGPTGHVDGPMAIDQTTGALVVACCSSLTESSSIWRCKSPATQSTWDDLTSTFFRDVYPHPFAVSADDGWVACSSQFAGPGFFGPPGLTPGA